MNETEIFWNAHTAVILLPFAVLGRISSIWLNDCNVSIKTAGVATFLLGTGVAGVYLNTQIGYLGCCYGNCLFFYSTAICSIYGICILSQKRSIGKNMKFLGRNTMSVLVMHKFLIMILLLLLGVIKYITSQHPIVCAGFIAFVMLICYGLGVIFSMNPVTSFILFGKRRNR